MLTRQEVLDRVRIAMLAALVLAVAAAGISLLLPRRFAAEVTLASIGPNRAGGGLGALSGSLGLLGAAQGGVSASPAMVRSLLESRRVAEQVAAKVYGHPLEEKQLVEFRRVIHVDVSRETGLINVALVHRDSSLARRACLALISEVTAAFTEISRAQGRQQRAALEERVDSAGRQLARAEEAAQEFAASNRVVSAFSERSVESSRRQRNVQLAQTVYFQAVSERDAALAHELEQAPAVVVVDPLPQRLPVASRKSLLIAALTGVATLCLVLLGFALRDQLRQLDESDSR
jgi:uncharacterized protein involved in exopolysaccharide biosynthesis